LKKILIIQTAYVGDVILATSLIENLRTKFPTSQIDFLLKKGNESLLQNNPKLNQIYVFDKSKKLISLVNLIGRIRREHYDVLINLHRFASSGFITFLSGSKQKFGFSKNPFSFCYTKVFPHEINDGIHEVDRNQQLISSLGEFSMMKPKLYPSSKDEQSVLQFKKRDYVCMAPASVWFTKQMPEHKWIELIQLVKNRVSQIYLIGGSSDYEMCEKIRVRSGIDLVVNISGKLSFLESAALMRDAKFNFVNDSGPLHLASAVNARVVAFFCSTTPKFGFGPLSDMAKIIEVKNLSCKPCGLHGYKECPKTHFNCGNLLDFSEFELSILD
jgi:ADP-heptose:LPS heptosyltransferase